jgi:hypothetical protein
MKLVGKDKIMEYELTITPAMQLEKRLQVVEKLRELGYRVTAIGTYFGVPGTSEITFEDGVPAVELVDKIDGFLKEFAGRMPEESDGKEYYTSPDAYELEHASAVLRAGGSLDRMPWSEWGSGGYKPYSSAEGRMMHEEIMGSLRSLVEKTKEIMRSQRSLVKKTK